MSAQPDLPQPEVTVPAIPHTIDAIGRSLSGQARVDFYREVLAAEEADVVGVMRDWWKRAMLGRAPGAERSRVRAAAGHGLITVDDLMSRIGETAR